MTRRWLSKHIDLCLHQLKEDLSRTKEKTRENSCCKIHRSRWFYSKWQMYYLQRLLFTTNILIFVLYQVKKDLSRKKEKMEENSFCKISQITMFLLKMTNVLCAEIHCRKKTIDGSRIFLRAEGQGGSANLFFLPKTARKWKNLDSERRGRVPVAPLDPPMVYI